MKSPDLLLIGGKPFSGKSSISRAFVEKSGTMAVRHLSMGDRLRAINSGRVKSQYSEQLADATNDLKAHKPIANEEAPIGILKEFIEEVPADLVVVDAFPRYPNYLEPFRRVVTEMGTRVLAVCLVEVSDEIAIERSRGRAQRYEDVPEDLAFVQTRLDDFRSQALPVIEKLAQDFPYYVLDGRRPVEVNVAEVQKIYAANVNK